MPENGSFHDPSNDPTKTEPDARQRSAQRFGDGPKNRFAPGASIGHYEVLEPLGQGGMGEVYLARDARLGRRVALKFLLQVSALRSARFFVEARATAQLTHENIVSLYDIAEHAGLPYMVLEYVPGQTLSAWMRERREKDKLNPVPPIQAAELMLPVVRALQCAHEAGIVHRDLKPANIMLAKSGSIKVLDFGVAKLMDTAQPTSERDGSVQTPEIWAKSVASQADLTETGVMVGTRIYMAPEQWWGDNVDGRTDIWAVGIMLFHLVTGDHPMAPLTAESVVQIALRDKPMPLVSEKAANVGELGAIIDRCLQKDIDARWKSARELTEALEKFIRQAPTTLAHAPISPVDSPIEPKTSLPSIPAPPDTATDAAMPVQHSPRQTNSRPVVWIAIATLLVGIFWFISQRAGRPSSLPVATSSSAGCVGSQCGARECSANHDCLIKSEGKAAICRKDSGTCLRLETSNCQVLADKSEIENDATIWIGAMYPYGPKGSAYGKQAARGIELARKDFQEVGGIPATALGDKPRPLGIVLCDDTEEQEQLARHLIDDVKVPVILGFARSKEVMDLATRFFLPKGILALASNTSTTLVDIPHLPGEPRLVMRVTTSADMVHRPKALFIEGVLEPLLKTRGIVRPGENMRIALVRANNASGLSHATTLISVLHWNGKNAVQNGNSVQQFVVPDELKRKDKPDALHDVADAVASFAPHLIVDAGADPEPYLAIERQWKATTKFRPVYFTTSPFDSPAIVTLMKEHPDAERRIFNVNSKVTPAAKKFVMHHNEIFTTEQLDAFSATTAPYDAFYTAAYAIIALADEPITGKTMARAIRRLVPPGETIEVGPMSIYKATKILRDGKNIDLVGAQTSLDFDPETGDATVDVAVHCMDTTTHAAIESGIVYEAKMGKLTGTFNCP